MCAKISASGHRHKILRMSVARIQAIDLSSAPSIVARMEHSPGFLKVVNEARPRVKELTLEQAREHLAANPKAVLMDVREDIEWQNGHPKEAVHLGKGVFERDIEKLFPNPDTEIIMYCGGGYRSVLTCDVAQRMGYKNVYSMIGGYKAFVNANWPLTSSR
jgi:rhodanese-related sulfurtransferase